MKKQLLLLVALFSTHFLFAQGTLVQWNAGVEKLAEKGYYKIIFKGELVDGWHAYSKTKAEASLDDPQLQFSSESISIKDPWKWIGSSSNYADPIFGNIQVPVYKGILEGTVSIQISGTIPSSIKVLLSAKSWIKYPRPFMNHSIMFGVAWVLFASIQLIIVKTVVFNFLVLVESLLLVTQVYCLLRIVVPLEMARLSPRR